MRAFTHWPIGKRLAAVLTVILGLSLLGTVVSAIRLTALGVQLKAMSEDNLRAERNVTDWMTNTVVGATRATAIARSSDSVLVDYFAPISARNVDTISKLQKAVADRMDSPAEKELYAKIGELRKKFLAVREEINTIKKSGNADEAIKAFNERFEPATNAYTAGLNELLELERSQYDEAAAKVESLRSSTLVVLIATSSVAFIVGLVLAIMLVRSITAPLREAASAAQAIGALDLTGQASREYGSDEAGQVMRAIDTMRHALRDVLGQVRGAVESISTASSEIAAGSHDLSHRTEETASNLQRTASAMEQLTSTVNHSTHSAKQANELVDSAATVAQRGGAVVSQVISTMEEINQSSQKISDIIGVIDGIAFQTNILALNAAVEAARAGEQGRGFAVVAAEVRNLAQRSASAAREIKDLINTSVQKVDGGTRLVQTAGTTMNDIVSSVERVSNIISEIAHSAQEQNQGIGQINTAVTDLDQMTQQNAALVEESTAAAASLNEQSSRLRDIVSTFKLDSSYRASHALVSSTQ